MKALSVEVVKYIHQRLIASSGGSAGLRDENVLEGCVEQPFMTFDGVDLYPELVDKAAALGFSLVANHPFVDGNKRIGYASLITFLEINGKSIQASVDEQEATILAVASGKIDRDSFTQWVRDHVVPFPL